MFKKFVSGNGAVTIEATISLTAFMFAIVTILTFVNLCLVQAKIAYAINTTANEISQYSYLYALTGINDRQSEIYGKGKEQTSDINEILKNVNSVYNEIENLGNTGKQSLDNIDDIMGAWNDIGQSVSNIQDSGSAIMTSLQNIASDPKSLMFGIAKLGASEAFDLAKSRLIAAPLAKVMCKRHLTDEKDGNVEAYLKHLGVMPAANGSSLDGLDFSESTLFPYGTSEITINVSYDVKVIPLLPIDLTFHLNQSAITNGWLAGEVSFTPAEKYKENNTLWTQSTPKERAALIRHMAIDEYLKEGYLKTKGLTDVQLYNPETNEFIMIASMNPLWTPEGSDPKTLADLSPEAIRIQLERLCGNIRSTTDGLNSVNTSQGSYNCDGATSKVVLVIPQDPGLEEWIRAIIAEANTNGVEIELVASYGYGASSSKVEP